MSLSRLGRYELGAKLGAGGMAEVFAAREVGKSEYDLAVKVMQARFSAEHDYEAMFRAECRLAMRLQHQNLVRSRECGEDQGLRYLAMERMRGWDLRQVARQFRQKKMPFPVPVALGLGAQLCDALAYLHALADEDGRPLGVVHRDISPHNVFVTERGVAKLFDFGVAKTALDDEQTARGTLKGKVPYMAPEQLRGADCDCRTDLFALGVLLFELVFGKRPHRTKGPISEFAVVLAIAHGDFISPHELDPQFPAELSTVMAGLLAPSAANRYRSAVEAGRALRAAAVALGMQIGLELVASAANAAFDLSPPSSAKLSLEVRAPNVPDAEPDAESMSLAVACPVLASVELVGGVTLLSFSGAVDEQFRGAEIGSALRGVTVLNLSRVSRVTSFGVREWLNMMRSVQPGATLFLARCSSAILTQLRLIRGFAGPAVVVSFFAEYHCDTCGADTLRSVVCGATSLVETKSTCAQCGASAALDDPGEMSELAAHYRGAVPADVRTLVASLATVDAETQGPDVEKQVTSKGTRVTVQRRPRRPVTWTRILDGVEGELSLDLGAHPGMTSGEARSLSAALRAQPGITKLDISSCPRALRVALDEAPLNMAERADCVVFEGRCGVCDSVRTGLVSDTAYAEMKLRDKFAVPCKRCGTALELPPPSSRQPAVQELEIPVATISTAPPPPLVATLPGPVLTPRAAPVQGARVAWLLAAALTGVVLVCAATLGVWRARPKKVETSAQAVLSDAPLAGSSVSAQVQPAVSGGLQVTVEVDATSDTEGLRSARALATVQLLELLRARLPSSARDAFGLRPPADSAEVVVERFERAIGSSCPAVRVDASVMPSPQGVHVRATYAWTEETVSRLGAYYTCSAPSLCPSPFRAAPQKLARPSRP
jgi:serine/threonine protein kinase